MLLRVEKQINPQKQRFKVADIGCGAGAQSILWAQDGHRVYGVDVNEPLVELAKERAGEAGQAIDFTLGSATDLPWPDESIDICLVPELLEHVADWQKCLDEFARVLRPKGILFVTTTNRLCPKQSEFNLPLYSWYPKQLKGHFEQLASTTRPDLVNYATYPAVNWFTFYGLRKELIARGLNSMDRFDVMDFSNKNIAQKIIVMIIRSSSPARWFGHLLSRYTMVVAIKEDRKL